MKNLLPALFSASILLCSHSPDLTKGNENKIQPGPIESNPSFFEENKGQVRDQFYKPRPDVLFSGEANGLTHHIFENGISYQLSRVESWKAEEDHRGMSIPGEEPRQVPDEISIYRVDVRWVNAQKNLAVEKGAVSPDYTNYYNVPEGTEPALDVRNYESVTFKNVWQGVDLMYYSREGVLESDWLVKNAEDYTQIRFQVKGAELKIDPEGFLIMKTPLGEIREGKLKVYQNNKELTARWVLAGDEVSFEIDGFQSGQPLRIDPPIRLWGTYYGGSGIDNSFSIAIDESSNVYLAGSTTSTNNIATSGGHSTVLNGSRDSFLVKFNENGTRLWGSYYGGNGMEFGTSCSIDNNGEIFFAGITSSFQNIATQGAHQITLSGAFDAFLVKFNTNGIRQWGTYYGGTGPEHVSSCAVDQVGNVFLVGETSSTQNIASPSAHQTSFIGGDRDAFLVKFNSNGTLQWGTYYGGFGDDYGNDLSIDSFGSVYIAGNTTSSINIATTGSHQEAFAGVYFDAFLVKFNTNGIRQWATYYGGSGNDVGVACKVDLGGGVYLTGTTNSTLNITTIGAHQETYGGGYYDAFLVKFNENGVRLWGTYIGGNEKDEGNSCAIDAKGNVYITGHTGSNQSIATPNAHQTTHAGYGDAFLVKFEVNGTRQWGTYYGGSEWDNSKFCEIDANDKIYFGGETNSTQNIATSNGHQSTLGGGPRNVFLVKFFDNSNVSTPIYNTPTAFSIFPNPSSGIFRVESENATQSYEVLDITGNTVLSGKPKASRFEIDLGKYPAGVYFVQLNIGGKLITERVVKMD